MAVRKRNFYSASVTTTDATLTTLMTDSIPANAVVTYTLDILATDASKNVLSRTLGFAAKRIGTGNVVLVQNPTLSLNVRDTAAIQWAIDIDSNATQVLVKVKGVAATTIEWSGYFRSLTSI